MLIKKSIVYLGIKNPETEKQIKVEIGGLKHAIAVASELITDLEQAIAIADLQKEEINAQNKSQSEEESDISTLNTET